MEKQMLTGIILVPTLLYHANKDANNVTNAIVHQLGALNCEKDNDAAVIMYKGILNQDAKKILTDVAKQYGHQILYLEAEDETPFINDNTFHIPTNDEMKKHLMRK